MSCHIVIYSLCGSYYYSATIGVHIRVVLKPLSPLEHEIFVRTRCMNESRRRLVSPAKQDYSVYNPCKMYPRGTSLACFLWQTRANSFQFKPNRNCTWRGTNQFGIYARTYVSFRSDGKHESQPRGIRGSALNSTRVV